MIKVLKPGLFTTVQDAGRFGYYGDGVPPSGAMDQFSYSVANLLVGNDGNAAVLEITYMGPELEFQQDAVIAVTGGEIPPKINQVSMPMWQAVSVKVGDVLSFDFVKGGARVYLAIAGGIDVPVVMGSRSTYTPSAIGGFKGRALQAGDLLQVSGSQAARAKVGTTIPFESRPVFSKHYEIRVMVGLCSYRLTEASKQKFLDIDWTVTPEADRMGYRFKGERLDFVPREQPFGAGSDPSNLQLCRTLDDQSTIIKLWRGALCRQ